MQFVTPVLAKAGICSICAVRKKANESWFLITENRLADRLNVWRWHRRLALEASVHSLCSPRHVRELVVHWMATGCLSYPFASMPGAVEQRVNALSQPRRIQASRSLVQHLGELSVDRPGILRALRDNPFSLNIILDELTLVLEANTDEPAEAEFDDEPHFALRSI
jgi:hypothetical protein